MSEIYINSIAKGTTTVSEFGGLNLKPSCGFNEFSYMKNMTSDNYPLLSTREARKYEATFTIPFCYFKASTKKYISHPYGFNLLIDETDENVSKLLLLSNSSNLYALVTQASQPGKIFKYEVKVQFRPPYGNAYVWAYFENNDLDLIQQAEKDLNLTLSTSGGSSGPQELSDEDMLTVQVIGMPQSNTIISDGYIYYIRNNSLCRKKTKSLSDEEILIEGEFSGNKTISLSGRNIVIYTPVTIYNLDTKLIYGANHAETFFFNDVTIECPENRIPSYRFIIKTRYKEDIPESYPKFTFITADGKKYTFDICDGQNDNFDFISTTFSLNDLQKEENKNLKEFIENYVTTSSKTGTYFTAKLKDSEFDKNNPIGELGGIVSNQGINFKFLLPYNNRMFACNAKGDCTYSSVIGRLYDFTTLEDGEASADWIEVNSNGVFTAITAFGGNVYYFKENCVHKLYGSSPSDWQLVMLPINGVEDGAHGSLAVENDICIYKSTDGFYYFDGSSSVKISDNLGTHFTQRTVDGENIRPKDAKYHAVIYKGKYYCLVNDNSIGATSLYTYDIQNGIWCCEENLEKLPRGIETITDLVKTSKDIYALIPNYYGDYHADYKDIRFIPLCGGDEFYKDGYTYESIFDWCVISGRLTLSTPNIKEINKIQIRAEGSEWTSVKATLIADENENEIASFEFKPRKLNTFQFPLKPLRCDNVKLKLEGQGFCIIHSITLSVSERTEYR